MSSFLVARYCGGCNYTIIDIDHNWYLDGNETSANFRKNSLEEIDYFTSFFPTKVDLIKRLYENGYIDNPNVDLFIAREIPDGKYVSSDVFLTEDNETSALLRDCAKSSMNGYCDVKSSNSIVLFFATSLLFNGYFKNYVQSGRSLIPVDLVNQILAELKNKEMYTIIDDTNVKITSYDVIRDMLMEVLGNCKTIDYEESNVDTPVKELEEIARERREDVLSSVVNPLPGQLSLFAQERKSDIKVEETLDETSLNDVDASSMISKIFEFMEGSVVPFNIRRDSDNKKQYVFNDNIFKYPIPSSVRDELTSLLSWKVKAIIANYQDENRKKKLAELSCFTQMELSDFSESSAKIKEKLKASLIDVFACDKSGENLKRTYEWCNLIDTYKNIDDQYKKYGYSRTNEQEETFKVFGKRRPGNNDNR